MTRKDLLGIGCDFVIVDGMNTAMKAAYVMRGLTCGDNEDTGVIYGSLHAIANAAKRYIPSGIIVTWEGKHSKAWRKKIYEEYKENRKKKDTGIDIESVYRQVDVLYDFIHEMGIGWLQIEGFEADDVIASLTKAFPEKTTVICTSDKDLLQLVTPNVKWYSTGTFGQPKEINFDNFKTKVGVTLDKFLDYKMIVGDNSDGIPGIMGIGDKTAKSILNNTDLQTYMETNTSASALPRTKNLFNEEAVEILDRNRKLMDLNEHLIPREEILSHIEFAEWNDDNLIDLLEDYDMWSILDNFGEFKQSFENMNLEVALEG